MKHIQKSACAIALLATISSSAFAESVDVRVIGTITPAACTPMLSGGGVVDYGTINPINLNKDSPTLLAEKSIDFSIACDAKAKVGIKAINGRLGTVAGATETNGVSELNLSGTVGRLFYVGLGLSNGKKIGGYSIRIDETNNSLDGNPAQPILSNDNGAEWVKVANSVGVYTITPVPRITTWADVGTLTPTGFTTLASKLTVQAYIGKSSELDLTKPIALNGLTTLELVYL